MKSLSILFMTFFVYCCLCTKFNIASTSTCTNTSVAGFCTRWQQNGSVQEELAACFSAQMIVLTKKGYKAMNELQIGDQILSFDKEKGQIYTKVRGWFHKDNQKIIKYLSINFQSEEKLIVSEKHNIGIPQGKNIKYNFAKYFNLTFSSLSTKSIIISFQLIYKTGMYAPMTQNSNYFVFTSKSQKNQRILAHDYANVRNPQKFEFITNLIINSYEFFNKIQQDTKIHPAAQWMMDIFSFLTE